MTPRVNTEDLVDAHDVARILGLSHPNSTITYMRRYEDFLRPVIDLGPHRVKLWLRHEIEAWRDSRRVEHPHPSVRPRLP